MKILYPLIVSLVFSFCLQAQADDLPNMANFSHYLESFQKGEARPAEDLAGIYAGKCFAPVDPEYPRGSAFILLPSFGGYAAIEGSYDWYGNANLMDNWSADLIARRMYTLQPYYTVTNSSPVQITYRHIHNRTDITSRIEAVKLGESVYTKFIYTGEKIITINLRGHSRIKLEPGVVWHVCGYSRKKF